MNQLISSEITSEEHNKAKIMKRNEDSLRDMGQIKHANIQIIGVSEEEEKEYENIFEEVTDELFLSIEK